MKVFFFFYFFFFRDFVFEFVLFLFLKRYGLTTIYWFSWLQDSRYMWCDNRDHCNNDLYIEGRKHVILICHLTVFVVLSCPPKCIIKISTWYCCEPVLACLVEEFRNFSPEQVHYIILCMNILIPTGSCLAWALKYINVFAGMACLELDSLFSFLFFVTQVNHATIDRKLKIQESHVWFWWINKACLVFSANHSR